MREKLEALGSRLLVTLEKPEEFLPKLMSNSGENSLVYQEEICKQELDVEAAVKAALHKKDPKVHIESIWGSTIYHKDDLPFKPSELPHIYGKFREKSEGTKVRELVPTPTKGSLPFPENPSKVILEASKFTADLVKDLGYKKEEAEALVDKRSCYHFKGGEDEGLKRCKEFVWDTKSVGSYAATRNQLIGTNYSSKLSPYFANGALSPRYVYFETKAFEDKHRKNDSTKVFVDELFWRDFNRYWCMKYGVKVFSSYGIYDRAYYNWTGNAEIV
jgi:deoxyribodipyrimidine photo-lyase